MVLAPSSLLAIRLCSCPTKNRLSPRWTRATGVERSAFLPTTFAAAEVAEVDAMADGVEVERARLAMGAVRRVMREAILVSEEGKGYRGMRGEGEGVSMGCCDKEKELCMPVACTRAKIGRARSTRRQDGRRGGPTSRFPHQTSVGARNLFFSTGLVKDSYVNMSRWLGGISVELDPYVRRRYFGGPLGVDGT